MKKLLLICGLLWSAVASAQFVPGQVLTAAQLNSAFALYAPLTGATFSGPVAVGSLSASGTLSGVGFTNLLAPYATTSNLALKAPIASPTFTGTVTIPSGASIAGFAPLASPTFTGTPTVPGYLTTATATATYATIPQATTALAATGGSATGISVAATTLSSSANDALLYSNLSGQTIPAGTTTTVTGWTKVYDRVNANFNAATGVFTAPATGFYLVSANLIFTGSVTTVGAGYSTIVTVNGAFACVGAREADSAASFIRDTSVSCVVNAAAGQTIVIQALQGSTTSTPIAPSSTRNFVSISRIP